MVNLDLFVFSSITKKNDGSVRCHLQLVDLNFRDHTGHIFLRDLARDANSPLPQATVKSRAFVLLAVKAQVTCVHINLLSINCCS